MQVDREGDIDFMLCYNYGMPESSEGRRIHTLAEEARESGDFEKALAYTDQASLAYQRDHDLLGLAEVQSSRQIIFKHLYRSTQDKVFLVLEKHAALSAVEIAEQSNNPEALGIPYHNLGKYYLEAKQYADAVEAFKKAVDNFTNVPNTRHGRPSVIADIQGHQFAAEYLAGDTTALDRALQALEDLEKAFEDSPTADPEYNKNAWVSGAHLRIAEMLVDDDPDLAKEHLQKAQEIIESDDTQVLRRDQFEKLKKNLEM
jgi:tetratricopeptide (TPR) repeat protein